MGVTVFPPLQIKLLMKNTSSLVESDCFSCALSVSSTEIALSAVLKAEPVFWQVVLAPDIVHS